MIKILVSTLNVKIFIIILLKILKQHAESTLLLTVTTSTTH